MSRESKLAKNTLILSMGTFLSRLTTFITLPILTGYLTQAEYGTYDLITVLVLLVPPIATLGIGSAAFRYLIDHRENKERSKEIITSLTMFSLPAAIITFCITFLCLYQMRMTERILISAYFLIDILAGVNKQIARGLSKNLDFSISSIISAVGKMLFALVGVWYLRMGLNGAIMALGISELISFLYLSARIKLYRYVDLKLVSPKTIKELLHYSIPMVPDSISMWIMRMSDRFVVTLFMGVGANAIYSVANKIPQILTVAQTTFNMAWQENASSYSKDEDASEYYSAMFRTMYDFVAGILGLLIAATPIMFKILIRGDYDEAYCQIPVLLLGMFFYSMSSFLGGIYIANKATRSVGITTMAAALCNLIADIAAIKFIGLYAASGSTLISYIILFVYRMVDICKIVKLKYDYKRILIVFIILVVQCFLCFQRMMLLNAVNICVGLLMFIILNHSFIKTAFSKGKKIIGALTSRPRKH